MVFSTPTVSSVYALGLRDNNCLCTVKLFTKLEIQRSPGLIVFKTWPAKPNKSRYLQTNTSVWLPWIKIKCWNIFLKFRTRPDVSIPSFLKSLGLREDVSSCPQDQGAVTHSNGVKEFRGWDRHLCLQRAFWWRDPGHHSGGSLWADALHDQGQAVQAGDVSARCLLLRLRRCLLVMFVTLKNIQYCF